LLSGDRLVHAYSKHITAEELLRMLEEGRRYELVRGELRTMTQAGHPHGRVAMRIAWPLAQHGEERGLGTVSAAETGFLLAKDPDTVRAPDAAFVRRERVEATGEVEGYCSGAPDLAVEVVSPGDAYAEVEGKVAEWPGPAPGW
jgi:Uma2 family endonuclease